MSERVQFRTECADDLRHAITDEGCRVCRSLRGRAGEAS